MKPEAESGILVTARELEERLGRELEITDWRAVISVVVTRPGLEQEAERACKQAVASAGLDPSQTIAMVVRQDEEGKDQLEAINRAREVLLSTKRLVCLRAGSAADVRFLRKAAPDLTSAIDLFVEIHEAEPRPDWPTCREQLRALMEERHGTLDFTGLLPASVEQHELPLAELYQPLVEPPPTERDDFAHRVGLLVLGHPGTGKTTYVRHLAWTYARGIRDPLGIGAKVPLLISLSDYAYEREHDRVSSLIAFLPRWLAAQEIEQAESVTEHLDEVLLLLDGLDEIRAAVARSSVLSEVSRLLDEGRIAGAVVTGRSYLVDELSPDMNLRRVSTREPNDEQIQSFLRKFVELRRGSAATADDLVRRVEEDHDLRALARTPLMLAFMAILDELEGRLPDRRIEIYYRLGEMLVDRWTRARSIGTSSHRRDRPTRADALRVLGPLAWWTVEQGGGAVSEAALLREIERIEANREGPEEARVRAIALLDLLRADTALLVPRGGQRWSFVHGSIGEYFAGIEAERERKRWRALIADPFRPEWREIVLFCAGQLGVIEGRTESLDSLVSAVLEKSRRKGRDDAKYPSLLIGLLEESPGLSRRQIDQLVERLLDLVLITAYSPDAAFQVQDGFTSLLFAARGSVADSLRNCLQRWFSESAERIAWDRLMNVVPAKRAGLPELARRYRDDSVFLVAFGFALGPVVSYLGSRAFQRYGIDLGPTLTLWRQRNDWRYRLAEWLIGSNAAERERAFGEVVRELGLE